MNKQQMAQSLQAMFRMGYIKDIREKVEKVNQECGREEFRFRAFKGSVSSKNVRAGTPYKTADQSTYAWGEMSYYTTGAPEGATFEEDGATWRVVKVQRSAGSAMMYSDLYWLAQRID